MKSSTALVFFVLTLAAIKAQRLFDDLEISPRISNGTEAARTQFPYIVGLKIFAENDQLCGGTVISENFVVSAAHCFHIMTTGVEVTFGAWSLFDYTEKEQEVVFVPRENVIVHEDFNVELIQNDIALIKMPKPIEFNEYIEKISLPQIRKDKVYPTYAGDIAIAAGWGLINDEGDFPEVLQYIKVPVLENSYCEEIYEENMRETNICVNTTGAFSTCAGDSGGPLVLDSYKPVLIGISSFGAERCQEGHPAVFTRITSYLDWIEKHTGIGRKYLD